MHRSSIFRTLAALLALAATPLLAADPVDVSALMNQAMGATDASVLLVPAMSIYRNALTEAQLQKESCRYVASGAKPLGALVAILRGANIATTPVYQKPDMREAVYLTMADGSRASFYFQDNNGGRLPVIGVVETSVSGALRSQAVVASATLATDLRTWAQTQGGAGDGDACNRRPPPLTAPAPLPAAPSRP